MATNHSRGTDRPVRDHYAGITAQVIAALEAGAPPWRQPWDSAKAGGPLIPQNAVTGAPYRGINTLVLGMSMLAFASGDPRWATYKQAQERGWRVRKGARGTKGFFYKQIEVGHEDGAEDSCRVIPMLRAFTLFHASQVVGIPPYVAASPQAAPWRESEAAATIARNSGAVIRYGGDRAFYSPRTDHIQLPVPASFRSAAGFESVRIHELAHWSGAESRLNRDLGGRFGSCDYAREELRAELAQVMVCAAIDLEDCEFTNSTAYVAEWVKHLRDDKREIFSAASEAQRIADYLLNFHPAYAARTRRDDERPSEIDAQQG